MTQTTTSRAGHALKPKDNFAGVDCVTIDSQIQESQFDDSPHYVHVWVDGDKGNKANKRYLSVREDQADWIARNQGKVLKPIDWMVEDGKTWLCPNAENTQVRPVEVPPDTTQYIQDDVDRLYPPEHEVDDALEMSDERRMAQVITQLGIEFPHLDLETRKSIALTAYINKKR